MGNSQVGRSVNGALRAVRRIGPRTVEVRTGSDSAHFVGPPSLGCFARSAPRIWSHGVSSGPLSLRAIDLAWTFRGIGQGVARSVGEEGIEVCSVHRRFPRPSSRPSF
jgi:hypothetical protein